MRLPVMDIFDGVIVASAFVSEDRKRFWFGSDLKKDGTPDGRARAKHIGVKRQPYAVSGKWVILPNGVEPERARALRERINSLREQTQAAMMDLVLFWEPCERCREGWDGMCGNCADKQEEAR